MEPAGAFLPMKYSPPGASLARDGMGTLQNGRGLTASPARWKSYVFTRHEPYASAFRQYCIALASSAIRVEPSGTLYSNSIVA